MRLLEHIEALEIITMGNADEDSSKMQFAEDADASHDAGLVINPKFVVSIADIFLPASVALRTLSTEFLSTVPVLDDACVSAGRTAIVH